MFKLLLLTILILVITFIITVFFLNKIKKLNTTATVILGVIISSIVSFIIFMYAIGQTFGHVNPTPF